MSEATKSREAGTEVRSPKTEDRRLKSEVKRPFSHCALRSEPCAKKVRSSKLKDLSCTELCALSPEPNKTEDRSPKTNFHPQISITNIRNSGSIC